MLRPLLPTSLCSILYPGASLPPDPLTRSLAGAPRAPLCSPAPPPPPAPSHSRPRGPPSPPSARVARPLRSPAGASRSARRRTLRPRTPYTLARGGPQGPTPLAWLVRSAHSRAILSLL